MPRLFNTALRLRSKITRARPITLCSSERPLALYSRNNCSPDACRWKNDFGPAAGKGGGGDEREGVNSHVSDKISRFGAAKVGGGTFPPVP